MERCRGLTLIEVIACVAISSIIIGYSVPTITDVYRRSASTAAINWVVMAVNFTRHAAISYRTSVTLCPSVDGKTCGGRWHEGMIAFTDRDLDRRIDGKDRILRRFEYPLTEGTLTWRAFGNRQYLQMISSGYTNFQNGNFVYCPSDGDLRFARQLVINIQGRPRTSKDTNQDGIVEDRRGKRLRC